MSRVSDSWDCCAQVLMWFYCRTSAVQHYAIHARIEAGGHWFSMAPLVLPIQQLRMFLFPVTWIKCVVASGTSVFAAPAVQKSVHRARARRCYGRKALPQSLLIRQKGLRCFRNGQRISNGLIDRRLWRRYVGARVLLRSFPRSGRPPCVRSCSRAHFFSRGASQMGVRKPDHGRCVAMMQSPLSRAPFCS